MDHGELKEVVEWAYKLGAVGHPDRAAAVIRHLQALNVEMFTALQFIESVYRLNVVKDGEPSSVLAELQRVITKATPAPAAVHEG